MSEDFIERVELEPGSLRRLIQASRTWDAVSRREMRANLRAAANKAADAARNTVRGLPAKKVTGLREMLADSLKVTISTGRETSSGVKGEGVRVIADKGRLPGEKQAMEKASMARSFRHPVFGRPEWVEQSGHDWFYAPLRGGRDEYKEAIVQAIKTASKAID